MIVGILARRILQQRKLAAQNKKDQEEIPVTWLIIDEVHLIAPSRGKTCATDPLREYAKVGRAPGCGLVIATQRPSATDDEILSQVDTVFGHNLSFEDDIKAFRKRIPSKIPAQLSNSDYIRSIQLGTCLLADSQTQQRCMILYKRPRMSHHGGGAATPKAK